MEATAKYDFKAKGDDELSFRKGDQIKILQISGNWYKAEINGAKGFVPNNFIDFQLPSWYQEDVKRSNAQERLMSQPAGAFLIRSSQNGALGNFSISVRHATAVQHFKVIQDTRGQYYVWSEKFPSLNKLVDFYRHNSVSKHSPMFLLEPHKEEGKSTGAAPLLPPPPLPAPRPSLPPPLPLPPLPAPRPSLPSPTPSPRQPRTASATTLQVQALYSFHAEEADELEFDAGDVIRVTECTDQTWWKGQLRGKTGLFPSSYTKPI